MYHMTANWSPTAQEDRHQLCYGVWGVVGSTGRWPQVVNLWEEDGFDGLARSFGHELGHRDLQDPKLAAWWAAAAELRSGGVDRLLVPAPWMPTIEQACSAGIRGDVYAHEQIRGAEREFRAVPGFCSPRSCPSDARVRVDSGRSLGDSPCRRQRVLSPLGHPYMAGVGRPREGTAPPPRDWLTWQRRTSSLTESVSRILLVDSALSPMRLGRQPARADRTEDWKD